MPTEKIHRVRDEVEFVDLTYKNDALRTDYDIESVHEAFTVAFIDEKNMTFIMFGDPQFDDLSDEEIIQQMHDFAAKPTNMELLEINDYREMNYHLLRYHQHNEKDRERLVSELRTIISCSVMKPVKAVYLKEGRKVDFVEYCGWNSYRYDMPLLLLVREFCAKVTAEYFEPKYLRRLSDLIINFEDRPTKFPYYLEETMRENKEYFGGVVIKAKEYKVAFNQALWHDGHIDWAKIAKANGDNGSSNEDSKYPPSLKKEMAKSGLDIIIDSLVALNNQHIWTDDEKKHLIEYNFNDVLGQRTKSKNAVIQGQLRTMDKIRQKYPYTAARYMSFDDTYRYQPQERDATAASIAASVLIGPKRIKPKDWDYVQYLFPVPKEDGSGMVTVDLLQYICEKESFVPDEFFTFFDHFRGKNTQSSYDAWKAEIEQPISKKATLLIPYYRDGKPIDACITVSTGGAHGFIFAGLSKKSKEELDQIIRASDGPTKFEKPTADILNVIHIDWSSFYPTMASKMQLYTTTEGIDRYTNVIYDRFAEKDRANELWEKYKDRNHPEYVLAQEDQMGSKFILNNATGAGNTHRPYALLPLDNKTLSMRLVGNMLIWTLAQRLVQEGAFILSTNTDGLYICNMSVEKSQKIIDQYVADYGMGVDPEPMARFINRDVSNRLEYEHEPQTLTNSAGWLKSGAELVYSDNLLGKNIKFPLIAANAAIHYMTSDLNWLESEYDRSILEEYITEKAKDTSLIQPWYIVTINSSSNRLTCNDVDQQHVNRVILTKEGDTLGNRYNAKCTNDEAVMIWNQYLAGARKPEEFKRTVPMADGDDTFRFDNEFVEYLNSGNQLQIAIARKLSKNEQNTLQSPSDFLPISSSIEGKEIDVEDLKELRKITKATSIAIVYNKDGIWKPIKRWIKNKLTGFTSETGLIVNTTEDLNNIDHSNLDIQAYVDWAENLLDKWKITADIEEIGLKFNNDAHITKTRVRKTNRDELILKELYGL